jgi:hypothetical protein
MSNFAIHVAREFFVEFMCSFIKRWWFGFWKASVLLHYLYKLKFNDNAIKQNYVLIEVDRMSDPMIMK